MSIKPYGRATTGAAAIPDAPVYNRIVGDIESLAALEVVRPLSLASDGARMVLSVDGLDSLALVKITGQSNPEDDALGTGIYACEILNPSKKLLEVTAPLDEESTADVPTDSKYYGYAINPLELNEGASVIEPGIYAAWYWTTAEDTRPVLVLLGAGGSSSLPAPEFFGETLTGIDNTPVWTFARYSPNLVNL